MPQTISPRPDIQPVTTREQALKWIALALAACNAAARELERAGAT